MNIAALQNIRLAFTSYFKYVFFLVAHSILAIGIGPTNIFAPDEAGYLYTFNNLYGESNDANPQFGSGWIGASKPVLFLLYLPAKFLTLLGTPDYLALRFESILLGLICVVLFSKLFSSNLSSRYINILPLLAFFIPSIFIWTSLGLREPFLLIELAFIFYGLIRFTESADARFLIYSVIGSLALVSTKNYQWILIVISIFIALIVVILSGKKRVNVIKLLLSLLIIPLLIYVTTTSPYALRFIFFADPSAISERSGDSVVVVEVPKELQTQTPTQTPTQDELKTVRIHGGTTLVSLHEYLESNSNSVLARVLQALGLSEKLNENFNERVSEALKNTNDSGRIDKSHILNPGTLSKPLSLVWPSILFVLGPLPFLFSPSSMGFLLSMESPLWWGLTAMVIWGLLKVPKRNLLQDFPLLVAVIYSLAVVSTGAIIEVNLGTSFRHRSLLLIPFLVIILQTRRYISASKLR